MSTRSFRADHFSTQAHTYARARPDYPEALYRWLSANTPDRVRALDVGCGSGQATRGLAPWFDEVLGIDASAAQLRHASGPTNVRFLQASVERCPVPAESCDLVTGAQAAHWFDPEHFHAEVERVLKPGGLLALWTYELVRFAPTIDRIIDTFAHGTVGAHWPPERRHVDRGYADLPFPYPLIEDPGFFLERPWSVADLLAYVASWSALERYRTQTGLNPLPALERELRAAWDSPPPPAGAADLDTSHSTRIARWRLRVLAGRKPR